MFLADHQFPVNVLNFNYFAWALVFSVQSSTSGASMFYCWKNAPKDNIDIDNGGETTLLLGKRKSQTFRTTVFLLIQWSIRWLVNSNDFNWIPTPVKLIIFRKKKPKKMINNSETKQIPERNMLISCDKWCFALFFFFFFFMLAVIFSVETVSKCNLSAYDTIGLCGCRFEWRIWVALRFD